MSPVSTMSLRALEQRSNECTWETAFSADAIPDYVLEKIPKKYRGEITGACFEICDGDVGEIWVTESSRPYDLSADYRSPRYYWGHALRFKPQAFKRWILASC